MPSIASSTPSRNKVTPAGSLVSTWGVLSTDSEAYAAVSKRRRPIARDFDRSARIASSRRLSVGVGIESSTCTRVAKSQTCSSRSRCPRGHTAGAVFPRSTVGKVGVVKTPSVVQGNINQFDTITRKSTVHLLKTFENLCFRFSITPGFSIYVVCTVVWRHRESTVHRSFATSDRSDGDERSTSNTRSMPNANWNLAVRFGKSTIRLARKSCGHRGGSPA